MKRLARLTPKRARELVGRVVIFADGHPDAGTEWFVLGVNKHKVSCRQRIRTYVEIGARGMIRSVLPSALVYDPDHPVNRGR